MDELRGHLEHGVLHLPRLLQSLRSLEHNVRAGEVEDEKKLMTCLFDLLRSRPTAMPSDSWDVVKFFVYTFILIHRPQNVSIPAPALDTESGPLFLITTLLLMRGPNQDMVTNLKLCFETLARDLIDGLNQSKWEVFYKRSKLFFARYLPMICAGSVGHPFESQCRDILGTLNSNMVYNCLSYNEIDFIYQLFANLLKSPAERDLAQRGFRVFLDNMFRFSKRYSAIVLGRFFPYWYAPIFSQQTREMNPIDRRALTNGFSDVIDLFYAHANSIVSDMSMSFPWHMAIDLCLRLNDDKRKKMKMVEFLCRIFDAQIPLDIVQRIPTKIDRFSLNLYECFKNNFQLPLVFFCQNLIMVLHHFVSAMKDIKAVQLSDRHSSRISFEQQRKGERIGVPIDAVLFSLWNGTTIENEDEFLSVLDSYVNIYEYVEKRATIVSQFAFGLLRRMKEFIGNKSPTSLGAFYYSHLVKAWFKFRIYAYYRCMLMQSGFSSSSRRRRANRRPNRCPKAWLPALREFDERFWTDLVTGPPEITQTCIPVVTGVIVKLMWKACERRMITLDFVTSLRDLWTKREYAPIMRSIVIKMMNVFTRKSVMFASVSNYDVVTIQQWVYLALRLCGRPAEALYDPSLGSILKYHECVFTKMCFQVVANQRAALETASWYFRALKDFHQLEDGIGFHAYDLGEIQPNARKLWLSVAVQKLAKAKVTEGENYKIIEEALATGDRALVDNVADLVFPEDAEGLVFKESASGEHAYRHIAKALRCCSTSKANGIMKGVVYTLRGSVPSYIFMKDRRQTLCREKDILVRGQQFSLFEMLEELMQHRQSIPEEAPHTLALLKVVLEDVPLAEIKMETLAKFVAMFISLYCFKPIRKGLDGFADELARKLARVTCEHMQTKCFLAIAHAISGRSQLTAMTIKLLQKFLHACQELRMPSQLARQMVDDMISEAYGPFPEFSIVIGLSVLENLFPRSLTISNLIVLVSAIGRQGQTMELAFRSHFSQLLKCCTKSLRGDEPREFVMKMYELMRKPKTSDMKRALIKRMAALGIPLPRRDLSHISFRNGSEDAFVYELTACLMCKIEGTIVVTPELVNAARELLQHRLNMLEQRHGSEIPACLMAIAMCRLIVDSDYHNAFVDNQEFLAVMSQFLARMMGFQTQILRKEARKCMKILVWKHPNNESFNEVFLFHPVRDTNRCEPSFFLNGAERTLARELIKVSPHRVDDKMVKTFISALSIYGTYPDEMKIAKFPNYLCLLKLLVCPKYVDQNSVRQAVLSASSDQGRSYLEEYIHVVLRLFGHPEISFRDLSLKYVVKFLAFFYQDTVRILFQRLAPSEVQGGFDLLFRLIRHGKSQVFMNEFLGFITRQVPGPETMMVQDPGVFRILRKLARIDRFAELPSFQQACTGLFFSLRKTLTEGNDSGTFDNTYFNLSALACVLLGRLKHGRLSFGEIYEISVLFDTPRFRTSSLYHHFERTIFTGKPREEYAQVFVETLRTEHLQQFKPASLEALLSNTIRAMHPLVPHEIELLFNQLGPILSGPDLMKIGGALFCLIELIEKNTIDTHYVKGILDAVKRCLVQSDAYPIIASLRMCLLLIEKRLLPEVFVSNLLEHILSCERMYEFPFCQYTYPILQKSCEIIVDIPESLAQIFCASVCSHLVSRKDLEHVYCVLQNAPHLISSLPFSLFHAILQWFPQSPEGITDPNMRQKREKDIDRRCIWLTQVATIVNPSESELNAVYNFCFDRLKTLFLTAKSVPDFCFPDRFYQLLQARGCKHFRADVLQTAVELSDRKEKQQKEELAVIDRFGFGLCCCATLFMPPEEVIKYERFILKHVNYAGVAAEKEGNFSLLRSYTAKVCKTPLLRDRFLVPLLTAFDLPVDGVRVERQMRPDQFTTQIAIIREVASIGKLSLLQRVWNDLIVRHQAGGSNPILYLMTCLEHFPPECQGKYLDFLLSQTDRILPYLFKVTPVLLDSPKIPDVIKTKLLVELSSSFDKADSVMLSSIYSCLDHLKSGTVRFRIMILLQLAVHAPPESKLKRADELLALLGNSELSRFRSCVECVPPSMWNNSMLVFLALLISERTKLFYPMFALAESFADLSGKLMTPVFERLLSEAEEEIHHLLTGVLRVTRENKQGSQNYKEVLFALLSAYHNTATPLDYRLLYAAFKVTNTKTLWKCELDQLNDRMLLPNSLSDVIFGTARPHLDVRQAAAAGQFFLSNYDEAHALFDYHGTSGSPFLDNIRRISTHFSTTTPGDAHVLAVNAKGDDDHFFCRTLMSVKDTISRVEHRGGAPDVLKRDLMEIEALNIQYFRSRPHATIYQKERTSAIAFVKYICDCSITDKKDSLVLPNLRLAPPLVQFVERFFAEVTRKRATCQRPVVAAPDAMQLFLPRVYDSYFPAVLGYAPKGFVSVKYSHLNDALSELQKAPPLHDGVLLFPGLHFAALLATRDNRLVQMCFERYRMLLRDAGATYFAAARMLTCIRLAPEIARKENVNEVSNLWFQSAMRTPAIRNVIAEMPRNMSARYALNKREGRFGGAPSPMDEHPDVLFTMATEKLADTLFGMDYERYQKQEQLMNFFRRCKMLDKLCLDLLEEYDLTEADLGSTANLLEDLRATDDNDLPKFIDNVCYPSSFVANRALIDQLIDNINAILPISSPPNMRQRVPFNFFTKRIRKVEKNTFQITVYVNSSGGKTCEVLLQKVDDSTITASFLLTLKYIDIVMRMSYNSRRRYHRLSSPWVREIGPNYILSVLVDPVFSVGDFAAKGDDKALLNYMMARYSCKEFLKVRRAGIYSFARDCVIRCVFALPRPSDSALLLFKDRGVFLGPLHELKIVLSKEWPTFNLPPQLVNWFGPTMRGELILAMSSFAQALLEQIDNFRALVEVNIGDVLGNVTIDSLLEYRDMIDANIVRLAPPSGLGCLPEDSIEWMNTMNELIDKSQEPVSEFGLSLMEDDPKLNDQPLSFLDDNDFGF